MGKGSARRNEDINKIWDNWERTFGKKEKKDETPESSTDIKENNPEKDDSEKTK